MAAKYGDLAEYTDPLDIQIMKSRGRTSLAEET